MDTRSEKNPGLLLHTFSGFCAQKQKTNDPVAFFLESGDGEPWGPVAILLLRRHARSHPLFQVLLRLADQFG
ncbi:hypothetical protein MRB53_028523 [Persea americana]|uniref:Uncharacterized protein n=1 Tax=Persea americana TaxID=3435 RepID=A0ACC2KGA7_PERAE|nr:hypothetical protein MRB53_028523 [Persea americana]